MKLIKSALIALIIIPLFFAAGCKNDRDYSDKVKISFELEGGIYKNCTLPINYYYPKKDSDFLIKEPFELSKAEITKAGYTLEGWYKTKTTSGEEVTYSDKWDFSTDYVNNNGITLYAKWNKNIKHSFDVCYRDENGEVVILGKYAAEKGSKFDDYSNYARKRSGYTPIEYVDEDGNPWNFEFTHPGGETDLAVKVYVNYIKGNFAVVRNASELKRAKNRNIYLAADIDLGGEKFSFGNYNKIFMGNNYTISNFIVSYDASRSGLIPDFDDENNKSLCISIFGNTDGASISDVSFKNVVIDINTILTTTYKIYLAPIAVSAVNSTISNVSVDITYKVTRLPNGFDKINLIVSNEVYYKKDDATKVTGSTVNAKNEIK